MILIVCANPSVDSFWTVETFKKGITNRSKEEMFYPGGKGIHSAFAINELGQEVKALGVWGGQTGQWLRKQCRHKNIKTIGPTVDQWNRLCITMKSDSKWNETELLGSGPDIEEDTIKDFLLAYKQCLANKNIESVIISGSVPSGFKIDFYPQLVEEAKNYDILAFVDASGPLLRQTLAANPFGIHVNQKEGQELYHQEGPDVIAERLQKYCELAAVTAGANGLYLGYRDESVHTLHKIEESSIVSTIGSGDCLLAGKCLACLKQKNIEHLARLAVACGSANCIHPELGMLKAEDVRKILPDVKIEKL